MTYKVSSVTLSLYSFPLLMKPDLNDQLASFGALTLLVEWQEGHLACKNSWGVVGVGAPLVRLGWRQPGLLVPLPPLSSPAP